MTVACETADGKDVVELCRRHHPDVVIVDFHLARWIGLDVARKTLALQAGVRGYAAKHRAPEDLIPAIYAVAQGGVHVSPGIDRPDARRSC